MKKIPRKINQIRDESGRNKVENKREKTDKDLGGRKGHEKGLTRKKWRLQNYEET